MYSLQTVGFLVDNFTRFVHTLHIFVKPNWWNLKLILKKNECWIKKLIKSTYFWNRLCSIMNPLLQFKKENNTTHVHCSGKRKQNIRVCACTLHYVIMYSEISTARASHTDDWCALYVCILYQIVAAAENQRKQISSATVYRAYNVEAGKKIWHFP